MVGKPLIRLRPWPFERPNGVLVVFHFGNTGSCVANNFGGTGDDQFGIPIWFFYYRLGVTKVVIPRGIVWEGFFVGSVRVFSLLFGAVGFSWNPKRT